MLDGYSNERGAVAYARCGKNLLLEDIKQKRKSPFEKGLLR